MCAVKVIAVKIFDFGFFASTFLHTGYAPNNIIKVLNGEHVGTLLFHKDAHMWIPVTEIGPHEMPVSAREASRRLQH
ncbi:hypothetical protein L1987_80765 [Smallanthus sonchifolius]|uniref:Uncharacterized protein n=1 Tax=Smallanthus sonchifolius TaxID=185202 RepID=A0ACB8YMV1_9ASTR|nr:hypothetical protein L1987_80765 [Smallanthus sonchifolius]